MRFSRGLLGALLWILASVVGLLAVVLCATIILLPVGVPLLLVARKMFGRSLALLLPRGVSHPVEEGSKTLRKAGKAGREKADDLLPGRRKKRLVPW